MGKKEKKTKKKGKKERKGRKHESVKIWQKYDTKGSEVSRKNKFCPRCGSGVWLSNQKNRSYCGKCGYTSFGPSRPAEAKPEDRPAEENKVETRPGEKQAGERREESEEKKPE